MFKTREEGGPWYRYTAEGEWAGRTAGGCPNNPDTAQFNPQYALSPTRPCTVFVALRQLEQRGSARADVFIGFKILNKGGKRVRRVYTGEQVGPVPAAAPSPSRADPSSPLDLHPPQVAAGAYSELEEVSCEAALSPQGAAYTLFVSTFEPGVERRFTVDVFVDAPLADTDGSRLRLIPESVPAV